MNPLVEMSCRICQSISYGTCVLQASVFFKKKKKKSFSYSYRELSVFQSVFVACAGYLWSYHWTLLRKALLSVPCSIPPADCAHQDSL